MTMPVELFIITRTFTRPNTSVTWWFDLVPQSHKDYQKTTYFDTGKWISETFEVSNDGLTALHISVFPHDQSIFSELGSDQVHIDWRKTRQAYCNQVGITESQPLRYTYKNTVTGEQFDYPLETINQMSGIQTANTGT